MSAATGNRSRTTPSERPRPGALGIDEHKVLSASRVRNTLYATSFIDVTTGQLLDVVRGRSADDVAFWLLGGRPSWRPRIEAVAIDPHAGGPKRTEWRGCVRTDQHHRARL